MIRKECLLCAGVGNLNRRVANYWCQSGGNVVGFRRQSPDVSLHFKHYSVDLSKALWPDVQPDIVVIALSAGERSIKAYRQAYLEPVRRLNASLSTWQQLPERIILVSSTRVYCEDAGERVDDDTVPASDDPYAQVLLQMEAEAHALPVPAVIARLSGIYGPGRDWLKRMALKASVHSPPEDAWTNRIHIDDAARALVHLARREQVAPSYLVSDLAPQSRIRMFNYFRQAEGLPLLVASETPKTGKYIVPSRLNASGFEWRYPDAFSGGY